MIRTLILSAQLRQLALALPLIVLTLGLSGSDRINQLERVLKRGALIMLTTESPTTYYRDGRGENGFEYLLVKAFADHLGVKLRIASQPSLHQLLLSVGSVKGDFAAANLTQTALRQRAVKFSVPYYHMTQQLLYRSGNQRPTDLNNLDGTLVVTRHSSHSERLEQLKNGNPRLQWQEIDHASMSDLIKMVHRGDIDYTVVDSLAYKVSRHINQRARPGIVISEPQPVAWAFANFGDDSLLKAANAFLTDFTTRGELEKLTDEMFRQSHYFSVANSALLGRMVKTRLPKYRQLFEHAAKLNHFDWHLLAAVSYQESHWQPQARSPTGVRGLMMLTQATAREMGVDDRIDPKQSILGGSRYLAKLRARLPSRIAEPDRTWLTLAAYNVGYAHVEDARILADRQGKNPDVWQNVREELPRLSEKAVYPTLKYGYARGNEAVRYVDNIQYYLSYLHLYTISQPKLGGKDTEPSDQPMPAPASL